MKLTGIIAIIIGFASLVIAFIGEGGHLVALFKWTPAVIVFGGTLGAVMLSFPIEDLKRIGKIMGVAFKAKNKDFVELIHYFKELAFKTRKNGLLSIEGEISADSNMDPFIKKGLQMIVDGVEPQAVREILELEADMTSERHRAGSAMFDSAGGFSPTLGIIGTVMGLVHVLGGLATSSQDQLGESIAAAFLATLYGVGSANLIFLPVGTRLKNIDKHEQAEKNLIIEAILLIQEGVNPNTLSEKLKGFLNKQELVRYEEAEKKVEA
ncbi:flagellar motor protein [Clostridium swellfunianum]|uniref:flagellar motor protein n=1 Tax=Clostridium swellfunianum TaxID=1367462 RepID=UPI00203062E4|nr:flagellar motor protein [Clostridium swellfunianum]